MITLLVIAVFLLTAAQVAQAFIVYAVYCKWQQRPLLPVPVTNFVDAPWRQEPEHYA